MVIINSTAPKDRLLRIKQVLEIIPVSRGTWWTGVRVGRFPKPVKLGEGCTCWRESDILELVKEGAP
jgi:predicted DNA-binding transcriptional regulator AlpA